MAPVPRFRGSSSIAATSNTLNLRFLNQRAAGAERNLKFATGDQLERTQEVQDRLPVAARQLIVVLDHLVGLRSAARVLRDRYAQVVGASVMQEEDALTDAPQRSRSELVTSSS